MKNLIDTKYWLFDLDNTLYKGILSEDGLGGLELTKNHKKLLNKTSNPKFPALALLIRSPILLT